MFFGYQKERIIKCQQVSLMARRWCNIPKTFFLIHLCEAPDFDKGQDCWPPRDSVFIPMCNKRYISKPQNKEIGSVSRKTDSPMSLLSCSPFLWLNSHLAKLFSLLFSTNLLTTLSISNLSISVIKYVFFQRRRLRPSTFKSPWIHRGWTPATERLHFHFPWWLRW